MVGGPVVGALLGIVGVVFIALGVLSLGACGNGTALIYFGIAIALFGGGTAVSGLIQAATFLFIIFIILVIAGVVLSSHAGCAV